MTCVSPLHGQTVVVWLHCGTVRCWHSPSAAQLRLSL